ncbi:hypothetical protein ACFSL6_08955 [Paenibacillus thailandensis]|uniref:Uncharacterized protein n=1 Tax=Paenibacillus thailandensis TaxID=393250 RepID=A0ABW5QSY8_9BACL
MVRDAVERLFMHACEYGVKPDEFYAMSIKDASSYLKGLIEKERRQLQHSAVIACHQANHIAENVARIFGSKAPAQRISELYPGIFDDFTATPKQQDWRIMKARIEQHAAAYSKRKRGEKNGADDRGAANTDLGGDGLAKA